jgi:DNA-binding NtrC family response regulator
VVRRLRLNHLSSFCPMCPPDLKDVAPPIEPIGAYKVLIIDDEPDIARILGRVLQTCGNFEVTIRVGKFDLERELPELEPTLIFLDLVMPDFDGFEVLSRIQGILPDTPVVVVSAYSTIDNAVRAVKLGAFDFLPKPFDPESVQLIVAKLEQDLELHARCESLKRSLLGQDGYLRSISGQSAAIKHLHSWILRVRHARTSVLVEGESGTGKELVARAIHADQGPFVAVNMAAIPDELADSELFGHRRGAFTGANQDRKGLLCEAHGGTLFLDEVNSMSPMIQAKLLRVIQERRVRPVGSDREQAVDFRIISATNEKLEKRVQDGGFRRDLYHRLRVLGTTLPPLRERIEDIPLLAQQFMQHYSRAHGRRVRQIRSDALYYLQQEAWPGNVRELENLIEAVVILCEDSAQEITLPMLLHIVQGEVVAEEPEQNAVLTLAEVEKIHVRRILEMTSGNKTHAARLLGIDYKTLLRRL